MVPGRPAILSANGRLRASWCELSAAPPVRLPDGRVGTVAGLKSLTGRTRPDGSDEKSFPSGHTSFAFSTATASYMIYKDRNPVIAWASYIPATVTGIMRISRNKHWVPDVLF